MGPGPPCLRLYCIFLVLRFHLEVLEAGGGHDARHMEVVPKVSGDFLLRRGLFGAGHITVGVLWEEDIFYSFLLL
jgi:hypothetical protein